MLKKLVATPHTPTPPPLQPLLSHALIEFKSFSRIFNEIKTSLRKRVQRFEAVKVRFV